MKVVVKRTNKQTISMRVDEFGVLQVLANRKMSMSEIRSVVESKRDWIWDQVSKRGVAATEASDCKWDLSEYFSGKKCLLFGEEHTVMPTVENKTYTSGSTVYLPEKLYKDKLLRIKALKAYFKKISVQNISDEISKFGCYASLCPKRIEFKNLAIGWVKCTSMQEKVVCLDFRICQLPMQLRRYLIVHAFVHFTNPGHESDFWDALSNYLPHYHSCVKELASYDFLKEI